MEINTELRQAIANEHSSIKSIEVIYSNGTSISGFIKKANFEGFNVTLCQHEVTKNENPYHEINFEEALEVNLLYEDGTKLNFD